MSLIEEALRRVKDPLVPPASTPPKTPRKAAVPQTPTAHSWSTTPPPSPVQPAAATPTALLTMVTIAILGLTAALIVGGAVWMWRTLNTGNPPAASPVTSARTGAPVTNVQPEPPAAAPEAKPEFNLTGIVEGLGEPYAVINGSIVAVGETVGQAVLLDIGEGTVKLRLADGKEAVLRVAR
ncbi:MAG: hypothetical protein HY353_01430 [Candidatus Omnitrophica bacterium]|nr:hypothetical protein [Candidatus Omnitrophota bacterium]